MLVSQGTRKGSQLGVESWGKTVLFAPSQDNAVIHYGSNGKHL